MSHKALNGRHTTTDFCRWGAERKWLRLAEEEARAGDNTEFTADATPLPQVTSFKYIGRIIMVTDNDWPTAVGNLRKERPNWMRLAKVLGREGADARTSGQIYLEVVQSVIMYGSETWVMASRIGRVLDRYHHRVDHRLTGRQTWKVRDCVWTYPPLEEAMEEAGPQEVETYVSRRQNTVAQFSTTRPIMDLCLLAEQILGPRVSN